MSIQEKWTSIECYSYTSRVAKYNWTRSLLDGTDSRDVLHSSVLYFAAAVSAIAETILTGLTALLDTVKLVYTLPAKLVVHCHNAIVEKKEVEIARIRRTLFVRAYEIVMLTIVLLMASSYVASARKK
jgi:hypothetical protein